MKARIVSLCLLIGLAPSLALGAETVSQAKDGALLGKKIANFTGRDFRGKEVSLADFADSKAVVVAFLGTECPLAKLYGPRLVELQKEFADQGVAFIGVDANRQDLGTEVAHFARESQIEFPLLKDAGNVIADQFGAQRTPEIFVLDKDRVVRYHGRVDDQYGFMKQGISYQRTEPNRRDLAEALGELLAGKEVSQAETAVQGCLIGRVKEPVANSDVTYSNQVARIFNANCVECHRPGQIAPFPLTSYDEAVGWADMIQEVVQERRMPPWHADPSVGTFSNDCRLSDADLATISKWVKNGAPEGDPKDLPEQPKFTEGWQIPTPDQIIYMADEAYNVPAEGTVEYQRFVIDPGWTEDKWIRAMECRPGNHSVVHHIIVYVIPPGVAPTGRAGRLQTNWLGAFAPGLRQEPLADGYARYVQKGSKLLFEMHYTPNGIAQSDRSFAGFVFADPATVKKEVAVQNAGNFTFKIPPQDPNYEVESEFVFRQNATLLTISPHMHVRGKDFFYELIYPDGKKETLLWVPKYDFGWQTTYWLTEPKQIPRGTKMHCVAHFDNSPDNLANPDPNATVQWGEQTWEEMMFGWFEMALTDQDLTAPATDSALRVKEFLKQAEGDTIQVDDQLKQMARKALASPKSWELVTWQILELVPQVDRVCITTVDGDKLRLKMVQDRIGLKTPFHSTSTVVKAQGEALADYAAGDKVVVNDSLADVKGPTMNKMARKEIRSSMHVPVMIDGQRCTMNFWSTEEGAFPPQAAQILEQIAKLVAEAPQAQ
ncbi:MAG TPA: redoxin domain-containing protein [Pirellulales bacterium]|nr:redoxin domain-containing protein [Pirellulales bacterium]